MQDIVEKAWIELSKESIFFSYARMRFDMLKSETVRTVKLSITSNGNFRLIYNPRRLKSKGINFTKAIIKHELYHIIFGHIFIKIKNERLKGIWDLAMDASINQYIYELDALAKPLNVMLGEGHAPDNEILFVTAPIDMPGKTAEEYFQYCLKFFEDNKIIDLEEIQEQREETDSHDFQMDVSEEMAFDIVSEFIQESYDKSKGDMPEGLEIAVKIMTKKNKFDWKTVLRRFFGSSIITNKYRSLLKPNRRYDDQPGWVSQRGPNVCVILDTSGSIIEEEYDMFFSEIEDISKVQGGKIKLIQADKKVQSISEYNKGNWKDLTLKGSGSTDLQPAVDYVEKNIRPEGIIIFTDGWVEVPTISRRVLFVLSKKYNNDFYNEVISYYGKQSIINF
ncbi:VWA-like domain-containing protein [Oceanotoga sp. DSM 15011]|uniref:vWA domain-containing protein n=1 Tax=Oceanotoga sp. DSM 15011 TaxID=2984951 RepID=UPI0021F49BFD|nr:VWA-like domain-containing protein [Oceanotoga sp. DSM 15011]UYO99656.1 VWA-like domain-containing protein [Oceanotoga sp. DSM 15011]